METSVEFAKYLFTWLTGIPLDLGAILSNKKAPPTEIGAVLLGLAGGGIPGFAALAPILKWVMGADDLISLPEILLNIPAIVISLVGAMKFLFTNAHGRYWTDAIFGGMTAEDHAAATVRQLTGSK
jgi:hypothetical protein